MRRLITWLVMMPASLVISAPAATAQAPKLHTWNADTPPGNANGITLPPSASCQ